MHGTLGLWLEGPAGLVRVGETVRLGVSVFDLEVAGRPAFHAGSLVDVIPTIRLVDPRGIEAGLDVFRDAAGRFGAQCVVTAPGMHSWTAAVPDTSRTLSFQSRR